MATMVIDPHVIRHKEYLVFTLVCVFYFSYAYASFIVAKLEIVSVE
jgi:hypothetical protein